MVLAPNIAKIMYNHRAQRHEEEAKRLGSYKVYRSYRKIKINSQELNEFFLEVVKEGSNCDVSGGLEELTFAETS